jgi:hypothetical protein
MFVASWPSGLRRAVQVRISPGARVRTTPMSYRFFGFFGFGKKDLIFGCLKKFSSSLHCKAFSIFLVSEKSLRSRSPWCGTLVLRGGGGPAFLDQPFWSISFGFGAATALVEAVLY